MPGAKGRRSFPPCGTEQGYRMHCRYGPPPCDACKEANRLRVARRRAQLNVCVECGRLMPPASFYRCDWCYKKMLKAKPKKQRKPRVTPSMEAPDRGTAVLPQEPAVQDPGSA